MRIKVTPENRHKVVESLKDLKKQIGNNEVQEFFYEVKEKDEGNVVSLQWIIKPNA